MTEMPEASRDVPFKCRNCEGLFLGSLALALHMRGGWGGPCLNPATSFWS